MLPREIYSTQQVRELDRIAIEDHGIPAYELMQRAGQACLHSLLEEWPKAKNLRIYCGGGNNGGDGYIIARLAIKAGLQVELISIGNAHHLKDEALRARQDFLDLNSHHNMETPDMIVDALFGTGLSRPPEGEWLQAIQTINATHTAVFSVDIPSGLNADTGMPLGEAVIANKTLCFIGMKQGLLTAKAGDYTGKLVFDTLDLPPSVYATTSPIAERLRHELLAQLLPTRKPSSHKGDCGHALIIGGTKGMQGAAQMAAEACARSGAGLTTMATEQGQPSRPEIMSCLIHDEQALTTAMSSATAMGIGPGLDTGNKTASLLSNCANTNKPLVVDAGALRPLASLKSKTSFTSHRWVLTPHPGEAAHLLNTSTAKIQQDRIKAIRALHEKYGCVCVLKGFGSLIYDGNHLSICTSGNPGMASGGMGDVLTGIICGLLAQQLSTYDAARLGVYVHAHAADLAAQASGERGLMATDLFPYVHRLVNPDLNIKNIKN